MKVGIFGLGYVGLTTAACLLKRGYEVVGYEVSQQKREVLLGGRVPLSEPGVEPLILNHLGSGQFTVAEGVDTAALPDVFFISVGTPSDERGATNLTAVDSVFRELATLSNQLAAAGCEVILRSTVPPGTLAVLATKYQDLFNSIPVGFYPEFLRESSAISDFENPPQTVLGVLEGRKTPTKTCSLFKEFGFEFQIVDSISAESLKFACNAFHALKVCFANEMGRMTTAMGGNASEVMKLFVQDTHLNISPKYLKPGAPYGGSCLPKDTRSIRNLSIQRGLQLSTISSCEESNNAHFNFIVSEIVSRRVKKIALLGLSFKRDTDDIRESPSVELLHRLSSQGQFELRAHDFLVDQSTAVGVNEKLVEKLVKDPEIYFTNDLADALLNAELIVLMHNDGRYLEAVKSRSIPVLDVAGWTGFGSNQSL